MFRAWDLSAEPYWPYLICLELGTSQLNLTWYGTWGLSGTVYVSGLKLGTSQLNPARSVSTLGPLSRTLPDLSRTWSLSAEHYLTCIEVWTSVVSYLICLELCDVRPVQVDGEPHNVLSAVLQDVPAQCQIVRNIPIERSPCIRTIVYLRIPSYSMSLMSRVSRAKSANVKFLSRSREHLENIKGTLTRNILACFIIFNIKSVFFSVRWRFLNFSFALSF
jgi:hypothetical protein